MRTIASAGALLLGLLAAGCTGELVGGGHAPASMDIVSGNDQQATVGQELPQPLVVKVVDEQGRPVRNQLVNFRVTAGGGSVFAGSALTNRDGIAQ
ncbi:MAG TPA: Ig-like domain-containing protein, partial [Longimicrobium sp.]|nr:Ig-like domain-containing protein [Longimicrobium sp.]